MQNEFNKYIVFAKYSIIFVSLKICLSDSFGQKNKKLKKDSESSDASDSSDNEDDDNGGDEIASSDESDYNPFARNSDDGEEGLAVFGIAARR